MKILAATNNPAKVNEFRALFDDIGHKCGFPFEIVTPRELAINIDPEENGCTFAENARIKAEAFYFASGIASIADDSGMIVDALPGKLGVYSKRYGGPGLDDCGRNRLLLEEMANIKTPDRSARFISTLCLMISNDIVLEAEGICEGSIAFRPKGTSGFGYDPVFVCGETEKTYAELSDEEKNRVSHRAKAFSKMGKLICMKSVDLKCLLNSGK